MTRIELSFPPSVNGMFKNISGKGRVKTQEYNAWRQESLWRLKEQHARPVIGEVSISIGLVAPSRRPMDCDNRIKAILDVLTTGGIIPDDSNRYLRRVSAEWLASGPACSVLIQEVEA